MRNAPALRSIARTIVFVPIFLIAAAQGKGQTRTVTYRWLNQPCAEIINCEGGCSACNLPQGDQVVLGTNAALIGLDACPHPFALGDNALLLSGWSDAPCDDHRVIAGIISQISVRIDSVIVVHRRVGEGPARLRVSISDQVSIGTVVHDALAPNTFSATAIADCGMALKGEGMPFASFQVQLQAYAGSGEWYLDELRIVMSPVEEPVITATMELMKPVANTGSSMTIDLLGRERQSYSASGLHYRTTNTIMIP